MLLKSPLWEVGNKSRSRPESYLAISVLDPTIEYKHLGEIFPISWFSMPAYVFLSVSRSMALDYETFRGMVLSIVEDCSSFDFGRIPRLSSAQEARVFMYLLPLICGLKKKVWKMIFGALLPQDANIEGAYKRATKLLFILKNTSKRIVYCALNRRLFF